MEVRSLYICDVYMYDLVYPPVSFDSSTASWSTKRKLTDLVKPTGYTARDARPVSRYRLIRAPVDASEPVAHIHTYRDMICVPQISRAGSRRRTPDFKSMVRGSDPHTEPLLYFFPSIPRACLAFPNNPPSSSPACPFCGLLCPPYFSLCTFPSPPRPV